MLRRISTLCVLFIALQAQGQQFSFRHFEQENGGPEYVYDIAQDANGILYLAAGERVLSFNGHEFSEVHKVHGENGVVTRLHASADGKLWMASRAGAPLVISGGKSLTIGREQLSQVSITAFGQKGNDIFFSTSGAGLWVCDSLLNVKQLVDSDIPFNDFMCDKNGEFLIATDDGIEFLQPTSERYRLLKGLRFTSICKTKAGEYWTTSGDGLYRLSKVKGRYVCTLSPTRNHALAIPGAQFVASDQRHLWTGTAEGCYRTKLPAGSDTIYRSIRLGSKHGLSEAQVNCILSDQEQNIWIGTFGEGLFQKPPVRFTLHGKPSAVDRMDMGAILPRGDSSVLIADISGVWDYNRRSGRWRVLDTSRGAVTALTTDDDGTVWAGTPKGVFKIDPVSHRLKNVEGLPAAERFHVNHLTSRRGRIYISTSSGLLVYHRRDRVEWLRTNEGLLHNNVRFVLPDGKGRLWIASHGTPPYHIEKGRIKAFRSIEGLNSFKINCIGEDSEGSIWIATDGDGMLRFSGDTFRNYTKEHGLLSDYCASVVSGRHLWISHRGGLSEKTTGTGYFVSYGKEQGLPGGSARHALSVDDGGVLWLGTPAGLISYSPQDAQQPLRATRIVAVNIDDEAHSPDTLIEKKFGHYTVRIDFLAVSLSHPGSVSYRYRLLGADSSWQTTTQRQVNFPQLADGSYTFEVCGVKDGNVLSSDKVMITIFEPVWQRPWFYLLLLALVIATTYGVVTSRTRAYRRRQLLLELKVKQKTFLLRREKEAVESIRNVLEEKNKDITDSINYAKKIQDSILPPPQHLRSLFGDNYFVLFLPKDIVSGDLYWASILAPEHPGREHLAMASVVDCTGHGVPGAFLSIMANDFLRQSIMEPGINGPHEVLDFLNEKISSHLNQTGSNRMRDGMDIALVGIDYKNKVLHFSGANNPVYIYRKREETIDEIILTATKQPIGMVSETTVRFASREFRLLPGDTIYLFSDGYADQFGGENNKKFTYRRFRELLAAAHGMPMAEQRKFLAERFVEWKGAQPQTDDVCVMGIRIA